MTRVAGPLLPGPLSLPRPLQGDGQEAPARSWRPVLAAWLGTLDSPHTIRGYRTDVERAMLRLRVRDLRELAGGALSLWRGEVMASADAPLTRYRRIVSVRSFLRFAARAGACPHLTRDVLDTALPVPTAEAEAGHRPLTDDQLAQLLRACATAQERAVIGVLCSSAPRRAELAALDCTDLLEEEGGPRPRNLVQIAAKQARDAFPAGWLIRIRRAKGGRHRVTPLADDVADLVLAHLAAGGRRPGQPGPLFFGKAGRITDREVYELVRRLAAAAGLSEAGISPHDLRATAAWRLYRATRDVYAVQALLGHRSLETTVRYLRDLTAGELRADLPPLPALVARPDRAPGEVVAPASGARRIIRRRRPDEGRPPTT